MFHTSFGVVCNQVVHWSRCAIGQWGATGALKVSRTSPPQKKIAFGLGLGYCGVELV